MTDFPKGMRLATAGDEKRLFDMFVVAHAENGYGDMDVKIVQDMIVKGCRNDGAVFGLIDGPERIEAVLGLWPRKAAWYNSDAAGNWYWTDLLLYVHPLHRRTRHAVKLFQFAKWAERALDAPVVLEVAPRDRLEDKERLFSRFGKRLGGAYLIGNGLRKVASDARH